MRLNARTIAGRAIGEPWCNHVPSRAIRISLSPQCVGFQRSTGGRRPSSVSRAISASDREARSGGGGIGMDPRLGCRPVRVKRQAGATTRGASARSVPAGQVAISAPATSRMSSP